MGIRRNTVPAERWTADDELSGQLLFSAIAERLSKIRPGNIMEVVVREAGTPDQIAAWCDDNGHRLVWSDPPKFWIERKP